LTWEEASDFKGKAMLLASGDSWAGIPAKKEQQKEKKRWGRKIKRESLLWRGERTIWEEKALLAIKLIDRVSRGKDGGK